MASLGEIVRVSIPNIQGKTIFIEDSHKDNHIVITVENKRIIVYNVSIKEACNNLYLECSGR